MAVSTLPSTRRTPESTRLASWKNQAQHWALRAASAMLSGRLPQRLSVMIFHRVLPAPDPFLSGDPDADEFTAVMRVITDRFTPLSLSEGVRRLRDGTLPPRAVCVTFDDGYADNLLVAQPILSALGIPFTVFVASGFLDGEAMWNDRVSEAIRRFPDDTIDLQDFGCGEQSLSDIQQRARVANMLIRQLKYETSEKRERIASELVNRYAPNMLSPMLTRDQVRELRARGVEIGGHTVTHPILANTGDREAYSEIENNKIELEKLLGERLRFFAYPNGKPGQDFAQPHADMVRTIGYEAALTTSPGVSTVDTDPFWLPRFTPWDRTPTRFALRMLLNMRNLV